MGTSAEFRLVSYADGDHASAAVVSGNRMYDAGALLGEAGPTSMRALLNRWDEVIPALTVALKSVSREAGRPLAEARLLAPVPEPGAIYCAGANYADHVARMAEKLGLDRFPNPKTIGSKPFHFVKPSRCCIGPDARVTMPSRDLDWEAELVAVIGRSGRHITPENALNHVAGYMVGNDLTARDLVRRPEIPATLPFHVSWLDGKGFEGAAPTGPSLVPAAYASDPSNLRIGTRVNGNVKQDSSTSEMIFTIAEQIAYLSDQITLMPGDLVFTGTPAGAGAETGEFLKAGDIVTVWIEGLGELSTHIV